MDCGSTMSKTSNGKKGESTGILSSLQALRRQRDTEAVHPPLHPAGPADGTGLPTHSGLHRGLLPFGGAGAPAAKGDHREALLQEQKTLSAQLEKRSTALKNLYLDKVSGVLSEGQFVELNQDFLEEKSRLERRLAQIDQELSGQEQPRNQEEVMDKARELLELKTLPGSWQ